MNRRSAPLLVGAACLALLVTGCTASSPVATPSPTSTGPASPYAGLPAGVIPTTTLPTGYPNVAAVRQLVKVTNCAATKDGWQAKGTVRNSGSDAQKITITVYFTTPQATVIDTAQVAVDVAVGAKGQWTAAKAFTAPSKLNCLIVGAG